MMQKYHGIILNLGNRTIIRNRTSGAYRIATELRQNNWDIEVVDFVHRWPKEELLQLLTSRIDSSTKFIGLSMLFTGWSPVLEEICAWIKTEWPDVVLIIGGMVYENVGSNFIDYYVKGYGEKSIIKLLKYLFSNGPKPIMKQQDGMNILLSTAIDDSKSTPWKDPMIIYEDRDFVKSYEWLGVEFSRGCKFACAFCNFPELGVKGDYTRDAESFEIQIRDAYERFGVERYIVSDETFNDRTAKITKYADVVQRLDFEPFFSSFLRADLLVSRAQEKEELLRMNLLGQYYGIESFDHTAGKAIGKGMDPVKLKQGLLDIKQYFLTHGTGRYRGTISLIAGLPHETEESMRESELWIMENWKDQSYMYFPLEIPEASVNESSQFTLNFEKYGYRRMDESYIRDKSFLNLSTRFGQVPWENEHTNYMRAQDMVKDFMKENARKRFKVSNWGMASVGLASKYDKIDDLLEVDNRDILHLEGYGDGDNEFLHEYIQQKLNYRK